MLGAFLSLLSATFFAINNATTRRGVITGTVAQAMAITVPMGVPLFFLLLVIFGQLGALTQLSWEAIGPAVGRRRAAFRLGALLQLSRVQGHRRQSAGPGLAI